MKKISWWFRGYYKIKIYGRAKERLINICSKNGIELYMLEKVTEVIDDTDETGLDTLQCFVLQQEYSEIIKYCKKTGTDIDILCKYGIPNFFYRYKKRKCFIIGALLFFLLIYIFSLYIWDINISGNAVYTQEEFLGDIKDNYVSLGTPKKNINCHKLEQELRKKYDIAWISCSIEGTSLNIIFTETLEPGIIKKTSEPCNLIAAKDCVLSDVIARAGVVVARPGAELKKGDIIISGAINLYNDYDELLETSYVHADGDIYGITKYTYSDEFDINQYNKEYTGKAKTGYSISVLDRQLKLYFPKIKYEMCEEKTDTRKIGLGNVYNTPFKINKHIYREYKLNKVTLTRDEAEKKARVRLDSYMDELRKKGVEILENNVKIEVKNTTCTAKGYLLTREAVAVPSEINITNPGE